mmetsp:Transcript_37769/g.112722  ORF Transcript_37769/g.112722 Transcript_37769/m.112722 type:complete len:165 (-) Transcript_37769:270-764(-)
MALCCNAIMRPCQDRLRGCPGEGEVRLLLMGFTPPCIFGAPERPAASSARLMRVCEATQEGSTDALPLDDEVLLLASGDRCAEPGMRREACDGDGTDGSEVLRQSIDALLARDSVPSICAMTVAAEDVGELGSSGFSYQEPSLPLPRLPWPRPPLLYGWMMVEL